MTPFLRATVLVVTFVLLFAAAPSSPRDATASPISEPVGRRVLHASFDTSPLGTLTRDELARQVGDLREVSASGLSRSTVVQDSAGNGRVLRVAFPANASGGAEWQAGVDGIHDSGCISYRVRFSPGFEFSKGGKLPGLAGFTEGYSTEYASGGDSPGLSPPDYGPDGTNAWSARMMWRESGKAITYLYWPDMGGAQYGIDKQWNRSFSPGRWHVVETCVTMNTPGQRNGSIRTRFDGQAAYAQTGMRFRDIDDLGISLLYFSTFRGGHDSSWYSGQSAYIDFDDFTVTVP